MKVTPTPTVKPNLDGLSTHFVNTRDDGDGTKIEFDVHISSPIVASNLDVLQADFASIGGKGEMPCLTAPKFDEDISVDATTTGYSFGTVTITDLNGYASEHDTYAQILSSLGQDGAMYYQWSDEDDPYCRSLFGGGPVQPIFTDRKWGPIPFVIAIYDWDSDKRPVSINLGQDINLEQL